MVPRQNADFGDALLCAFAHHQHCDVSTFDRDLIEKFTGICAVAPVKAKIM